MEEQPTPTDIEFAKTALKVIADHRKSDILGAFIATGQTGNAEMDVGEAFRTFDISDRTIDDDTIIACYRSAVNDSDSVARHDNFRRALSAIAMSKDSQMLKNFMNEEFGYQSTTPKGSNNWPVGLENIGNTCYLNSLLQFYFTVVPLRDIVLNFEKFKMEVTESTLKQKRVGSRQVKGDEVRRAQRCTYTIHRIFYLLLISIVVIALRKLFRSMITSAKTSVTPEQEVALLTLVGHHLLQFYRLLFQRRSRQMVCTHLPRLLQAWRLRLRGTIQAKAHSCHIPDRMTL